MFAAGVVQESGELDLNIPILITIHIAAIGVITSNNSKQEVPKKCLFHWLLCRSIPILYSTA